MQFWLWCGRVTDGGRLAVPVRAKPNLPNSMEQVARSIDTIEDKVLDDGTVVIKQPDVYGESRMTLYRRTRRPLSNAVGNFNFVLSARVVRTDQAALQSQTFLSNALSSGGGTSSSGLGGRSGKSSAASMNATTVVAPASAAASPSQSEATGGGDDLSLPHLETGSIDRTTKPFGYGTSTFQGINTNYGGFGLEPTVYLDQLKNYQDHLNQIRRVNMGDDIADSPGYALYQIRMPVSIQPGECTRKGHGAVLTATLHHEFGPDFLETTFRNLAINDLVDQMGPLIYELIRSEDVNKCVTLEQNYQEDYKNFTINIPISSLDNRKNLPGKLLLEFIPKKVGNDAFKRDQKIAESATRRYRTTMVNSQEYAVAPSDYNDVFFTQNVYLIAANVRDRLTTKTPRANEVNAYLRRKFEAAYRLLPHFEAVVPDIAQHIQDREFDELKEDYIKLATMLPGDLQFKGLEGEAEFGSLVRTLTMISYWVAVEWPAQRTVRHDIRRVSAGGGFACADLETMQFYAHDPQPEAEQAFHDYVKRGGRLSPSAGPGHLRAEHRRRLERSSRSPTGHGLRLLLGQIRFRQFLQYQRRIEQDSEAIALNRTVTTFTHGNETFGFRFYPRYQTRRLSVPTSPPSTISLSREAQAGITRSKTVSWSRAARADAVVIMPSFLRPSGWI